MRPRRACGRAQGWGYCTLPLPPRLFRPLPPPLSIDTPFSRGAPYPPRKSELWDPDDEIYKLVHDFEYDPSLRRFVDDEEDSLPRRWHSEIRARS